MNTETMIRELNNVAEKHSKDKLHTFDTNISSMCMDIIPKLEKLKEYEDMEEQGRLVKCTCKECKHGKTEGCREGNVYCKNLNVIFTLNDFCSRAEKK